MNPRVAVRGIIILDDKLFCVRQKPYRHAEANTYWCTPGGGLDDGETLIGALEREMLEETGVSAKVGQLLYIHQFKHKDVDQIEFFFLINNPDDYQNIDLNKSTHGLNEIEEFGFINPTSETVLPEFLTTEKFDDLLESAPKIFSYL